MLSSITRFLRDEEGATAIEYGIIAGLISVVMITAITGTDGIGKKVEALWIDIKAALPAA
ncbi:MULTISPECIES: Flp family type IVb pilin [Variovorax]|uniref:Flp family type IVb pilin n=1 Tax=Variovorax TaxID=34072 RepID=UPI0009ED912E|nr:Flp family type IVb pilin [Variovorax boronicumulans]